MKMSKEEIEAAIGMSLEDLVEMCEDKIVSTAENWMGDDADDVAARAIISNMRPCVDAMLASVEGELSGEMALLLVTQVMVTTRNLSALDALASTRDQ